MNHANLVIQTFDEPKLDLVARRAIRGDTIPVPFDQSGNLLEGPEPLPFERLTPTAKALPRPAFSAITPDRGAGGRVRLG